VVVEEFIEGSRHGLSTFVRDGRVVFYFDDDEYYYLNPYLVSGASTPGSTPAGILRRLCNVAEKIASLLNLKTGIFHIQYILREGEPFIIEICRRAPGDLYTQFVHVATGIDYPSFIVRGAAGLDCSDLIQMSVKGCFTRHCVMAADAGRVSNVTFEQSIQGNVIDQLMWWKTGDKIDDVMTQKLGIVFMKFNAMDEMIDKTKNMPNLIRVNMA
jgi:biotin carboxylase